ncbi:hypothetical protein M8542_26085 [Amycolatopsis sp. OK19-0408]|uniref:Uncharacterized protein n=1 Tax=Amycolatopsis iheyensis TaxID=2945988 RepID=A0A9X2NCJ6_9PSEU|nr:hypothetical protein [Amycolatopsis iheyensis]MCR6486301.1 hypothetical protein [Amycolatopsis iheyensis]
MNISEEELEQRLRALFADERLDLPPPANAAPGIVAGARRRRRRRRTVQVVAGVAVAVVAVSGGLTMLRLHTEDGTAVMTADGGEISVKPPENLTPGRQPQPSTPGPTSTHDIQVSSTPGTPAQTAPDAPPPVSGTKLPGTDTALLRPDGFGKLKLGMSEADLTAQAVTLTNAQTVANCTTYEAQAGGLPASASVVISKAAGLIVINPDVAPQTAEGIGAGATKDQVLEAYPAAKEEPGGVVAPVSDVAAYHFRLDGTSVVGTSLASVNQDCAN